MSDHDKPRFGANIANNITDRELKQARAILAVIGLLTLAVQLVAINEVHHQINLLREYGVEYNGFHLELAAYFGLAVGGVFLACAFLVSRKPVFATSAGFALYVAGIVIQAVVDPSSMLGVFALGVRVVIVIALVSAMTFARAYERNRRARSG
jgi:hypothetical protein